ncbi:putative nachr subunit [Schistosoma mansoni]|uniref:putative nachr subunit n=1 Tax=Schistosoma mansoni TaxID=6183 RepID=UPI00022DBF16|nr:putative nachr subunit [Schistosoma mansoni]|eukprot:XP_018651587.1 putative nachr subunit [Schistosoma mansoni]
MNYMSLKFEETYDRVMFFDELHMKEWIDERLTWNPQDYNNLSRIRIPCQKLWLPDIVLYNSADDYKTDYMQSKAMVQYNGNVFWPPPAKLRSTCKIDITYFPFDDQSCTMKFGSWTYDGWQVNVIKRLVNIYT